MYSRLRRFLPLNLVGLGRCPDPHPSPAQVEANMRHLIWEMTWYGILTGTAVNFMQVYIVRLGAPSLLVGAITYGPALVSILAQLPLAALISRSGRRMVWVLASSLSHRTVILVIALLPFFVTEGRAELTVLLLVFQAIPMISASTAFLSMMADAVPPENIPNVVSYRMAGFGLTTTFAALLAGPLLRTFPFPLNYQVLFLIGYVASLISQWHVSQLCVPDHGPAPIAVRWWQGIRASLQSARFVRFAVIVGVLQMAIGMVAPLFPLFWVRQLGATDVQISILVTIYSGSMVIGSLSMRRAVHWIGRERALIAGAVGFGLYPLLASFSPSVWWLIPWAVLGGLFYAVISVTLFDNLVANTPVRDRTNFIAVYNIFVNLALFLGPLLAGLLASSAGGPALGLKVAGGFGLLAGLLFGAWLRMQPSQARLVEVRET